MANLKDLVLKTRSYRRFDESHGVERETRAFFPVWLGRGTSKIGQVLHLVNVRPLIS